MDNAAGNILHRPAEPLRIVGPRVETTALDSIRQPRPKREEESMEKSLLNYETLLKITQRISMSREFEDIALLSVTGVRDALQTKGCALFLIPRRRNSNSHLPPASAMTI
jgi:hypothetical protein